MSADDALLRARISVPDHVVLRRFADDCVALNLSTGQYHGLNETAAAMLEALAQGDVPVDVARSIAEQSGVDAGDVTADLLELLRELAERELIEVHEAA